MQWWPEANFKKKVFHVHLQDTEIPGGDGVLSIRDFYIKEKKTIGRELLVKC